MVRKRFFIVIIFGYETRLNDVVKKFWIVILLLYRCMLLKIIRYNVLTNSSQSVCLYNYYYQNY